MKTSEHKLYDKVNELKAAPEAVDILIAADTIISFEDREVIEKASDDQNAFTMLKSHVERRSHDVYTSVWIAFLDPSTQDITRVENFVEKTTVHFWEGITDEMLWAYVKTGEPFGKAGGYGAQS